jgi:hypothetical protein
MCRGTEGGAEELKPECQSNDNAEWSTQTIDQAQQDEGTKIWFREGETVIQIPRDRMLNTRQL